MNFLKDFEIQHDYKIAYGDIKVLDDIATEMQVKDNDFSPFLKKYCNLSRNQKILSEMTELGMKTVIALSFPLKKMRSVELNYDNKTISLVVPPGYDNSTPKYKLAFVRLSALLAEHSIRCVEITPSLKNLSTRLGLAQYGRNNITYVEGFGSCHSVLAVACDYELGENEGANLREPSRMEQCENCNLCINACKSGAISKERYLIDMQKCITLYNESQNDWSEPIMPHMQKYFVGCGSCQFCCPKNKGMFEKGENFVFSIDETMAVVNNSPLTMPIIKNVYYKLEEIGVKGYEPAIFHTIKSLYHNN